MCLAATTVEQVKDQRTLAMDRRTLQNVSFVPSISLGTTHDPSRIRVVGGVCMISRAPSPRRCKKWSTSHPSYVDDHRTFVDTLRSVGITLKTCSSHLCSFIHSFLSVQQQMKFQAILLSALLGNALAFTPLGLPTTHTTVSATTARVTTSF